MFKKAIDRDQISYDVIAKDLARNGYNDIAKELACSQEQARNDEHERLLLLEKQRRALLAQQTAHSQVGAGLGQRQSYQQWAPPSAAKQTEVELCGIRFTEREVHCLHKLCERMARLHQLETDLPADIDQAVKEAVNMLK